MPNEWPNLLSDLKAKRDALDQVIATIETYFTVPDAVAVAEKPKRMAVNGTNERTNERSKGRATSARGARSLPNHTEPR